MKDKNKIKDPKRNKRRLLLFLFLFLFTLLSFTLMLSYKIKEKRSSSQEKDPQIFVPPVSAEFLKSREEYKKNSIIPQEFIKEGSLGESAFLGDYFHANNFSVPGEEQIIQISPTEITGKTFHPGEELTLKGKVKNPEAYPLIDIQLQGMIYRIEENETKRKNYGNHLIDSFLIWRSVDLKEKEAYLFEHKLKIPAGLPAGNYAIVLNLIQGEKFPLRGYPYVLEGIDAWFNPLGSVRFKLESKEKNQGVWIDRSSVKIEDERGEKRILGKNTTYSFYQTRLLENKLKVSFLLINEKNEKVKVELKGFNQRLGNGFWGGTNEEEKYFEKKILELEPQEKREVSYSLEFTKTGGETTEGCLYTLLFVAESFLGDKYILSLPLKIINCHHQERVFLLGLNKFPLKKEELFDIWIVFDPDMGEEQQSKKIKIEILALDKNNKEIGRSIFLGDLPVDFNKEIAWKNSLKAEKNINYLKLVAKIYKNDVFLVDEFEREYDCTKITDGYCLD